jgi:hypothetical protein
LELFTGNVVICEVDVLMYVVLSKEQQHVPYRETVPLNAQRYRRGVALTEVIITDSNCICIINFKLSPTYCGSQPTPSP